MNVSRRFSALVGALLTTLALSAPAHAAAPGVNISDYNDTQAALDAGAKQVRFFVRWSDFEGASAADYTVGGGALSPNIYTTGLPSQVNRVLAAGATPILVVLNAPGWASVSGHPRSAEEYASFMGELAANLSRVRGGRGTIAYEVWNEPDGSLFWGSAPDPDFYAQMLKASYAEVKAADPGATVLTGPTTGNDVNWIKALYERGAKGSFDGVSVHTDTACLLASPDEFYRDDQGRVGQFSFLGYREVRKEMLANGDDKPIWMSEFGWSTTHGGPTSCTSGDAAGKRASGVDEATQARFITQAFSCMAADPYLVAATLFTLRDAPGSSSSELANYGLLRRDGSAKPGLTAFKRAGSVGAGPCGDFQGPDVRVISPAEGQQYTDRLDLRASASDSGVGVARITYTYDGGRQIRNFTDQLVDGRPFGLSPWFASSGLPLGPHTVEVIALDKNGNTTTRAIHVTRVAPGALAANALTSFRMPTRVVCQRRACSLKSSLRKTVGAGAPGGKVAVEWQWKNKQHRWRKLVGGLKPASKPFTFTAKLRKAGHWRVRVVYTGVAPYRSVTSRYLLFSVK